jgi:hypothetical protein
MAEWFKNAAIVLGILMGFLVLMMLMNVTNQMLATRCAQMNGEFAQAMWPLASTCTVRAPLSQ